MDVIFDLELLAKQVGDPGTGPEIRWIARSLCAPQQLALQLPLAPDIEARRPSGSRLGLDRALPRFEETGLPSAHGTEVDLQLSGNIDRLEPLFKQADGVQAAIFELGWAAEWSHAQRIGHYLGVYQ